jgi:hypothetical protein
MAQDFDMATVTDAGKEAMQEALEEGYSMVFSRLVTGNGTYTEGETIKTRTALKSQKNWYPFSSIKRESDGVTLKAVITNQEGGIALVTETYNINEIGIYVTVNGTETLYAIAAVGGGTGMELPAFDGYNAMQIVREWFVANSNDADITVDMSTALALASDLALEIEVRSTADFENLYGLCSKNTTIRTNQQGQKVITETDTANSIMAVTTIVPTSSTVKTITTVITPDDGDYIYTKTTVITKVSEGTNVTESYTKALKA